MYVFHSLRDRRCLLRLCSAVLAALAMASVGAAVLDLDEYLQRGNAAKLRADWQSAASQFAQAVNHPDLPADGAERSMVYREYGRAMGALCRFDKAQTYLLRARQIAQHSGSSTFPVLYDLGAISVAHGRFADAVDYFSQLAPVIERESRARIAPQVVADVYEKFAVALAATGKPQEAGLRRQEALRLREANPGPAPPGTLAPYGAPCPKS